MKTLISFLTLFMNLLYLFLSWEMRVMWEHFACPQVSSTFILNVFPVGVSLGDWLYSPDLLQGICGVLVSMCWLEWWIHWPVGTLMVRRVSYWNFRSPLTLPSAFHVIGACRVLKWVNEALGKCPLGHQSESHPKLLLQDSI